MDNALERIQILVKKYRDKREQIIAEIQGLRKETTRLRNIQYKLHS